MDRIKSLAEFMCDKTTTVGAKPHFGFLSDSLKTLTEYVSLLGRNNLVTLDKRKKIQFNSNSHICHPQEYKIIITYIILCSRD